MYISRQIILSSIWKQIDDNITLFINYADGYAPDGFDNFKDPVIISIKYNLRKMNFCRLSSVNKEVISLYIVNSDLSKSIYKRKLDDNVVVWDKNAIEKWVTEYPIDYYDFYRNELNLEKNDKSIDDILNF